ncbi:MAG: hypothetical protein ACOCRO_01810 [Halanaerobiales bacterium]
MARPKWLLKPADLFRTRYGGFMIEGEGIVFSYKKRYGESLDLQYFVLFFNNSQGKSGFLFHGDHFSNMQNVRDNIEINRKFSKKFKSILLKSIFESANSHDLNTIKKFSQKIKEYNLGEFF